MPMIWDLWVDFNTGRADGTLRSRTRHARPGLDLTPGAFVVVGCEDADPAVAEVLEVDGQGRVTLRVLPGRVDDHLDLVPHYRTEARAV